MGWRRAVLVSVVAILPACQGTGTCTPTQVEAREGAVVDLTRPLASAVLEARLTSAGTPLGGRSLEFWLRADGQSRMAGEAETHPDGTARFDLRRQVTDLLQGAQSASFEARFRGDGTYCASADEAPIRLVRTP